MGLICIVRVFNDRVVLIFAIHDIKVKWITFQIPNGQVAAMQTLAAQAVVAGVDKYCGRYLSADAGVRDAIVCCKLNTTLLCNP